MSAPPIPRPPALVSLATPRIPLVQRILRDWFTDATGQGYSIARGLGTFIILVGVLFPIVVGFYMAAQLNKPTMAEWVSFLSALVAYIPAVAAAGAGLIVGAGVTDPGGAFWSSSNAPPSTTRRRETVDPTPPAPSRETVETRQPGTPTEPPPD